MSSELNRPEPVYVQVARSIRQRIVSGELKDGDHVPSVREIMDEWGIAISTAQKVISALKSEGLVQTLPGNGTVVAATDTLQRAAMDRLTLTRTTGRIYPPGERAQIRSAEMVTAPAQVADALGVEPGASVIRRHRVTYRDGEPVSASTSWIRGDLAEAVPALLATERITKGTMGLIGEVTGRAGVSGCDQMGADAATTEDAGDLGVEVGSPVFRGRNWVTDADGGVIEYGESVAVPGRFVTYEYQLGDRP